MNVERIVLDASKNEEEESEEEESEEEDDMVKTAGTKKTITKFCTSFYFFVSSGSIIYQVHIYKYYI